MLFCTICGLFLRYPSILFYVWPISIAKDRRCCRGVKPETLGELAKYIYIYIYIYIFFKEKLYKAVFWFTIRMVLDLRSLYCNDT